jgi:hypothetical protein
MLTTFNNYLKNQDILLKPVTLRETEPIKYYLREDNGRYCHDISCTKNYITNKDKLTYQYFQGYFLFFYLDNMMYIDKNFMSDKICKKLIHWFENLNNLNCCICYKDKVNDHYLTCSKCFYSICKGCATNMKTNKCPICRKSKLFQRSNKPI